MNSNLQRARKAWNDEVDNEAARLIDRGVEPMEALQRAVETVKSKRNAAAQTKSPLGPGSGEPHV